MMVLNTTRQPYTRLSTQTLTPEEPQDNHEVLLLFGVGFSTHRPT